MRLFRLIAVPLVGLFATGCDDPTAPQRVTAFYVLESISGQPLPATFTKNRIETATVLWATLYLDKTGNASTAEGRRSEFATGFQERTNTRVTVYEIVGETLRVGVDRCGSDVLSDCYPPRIGKIAGSILTLSGEVSDPHSVVYTYRLVPRES